MRKKITLLKNSDINGWDNNKNNPDFFVDKNRNNISTPILQEMGVDSYTIFSKYVTVEINDNIYNFFNNLFKELYSIIETFYHYDVYISPIKFQYNKIYMRLNNDYFTINDFNEINFCYFKLSAKYKKIQKNKDGANACINIDDIIITVHDNKIKIKVYYKMSFNYDVEKCIFTDCYFETEIYGDCDSHILNYTNNSNYLNTGILVINTAKLVTETFECAFNTHIENTISTAVKTTENVVADYVNSTCDKFNSPLMKKAVIAYINRL